MFWKAGIVALDVFYLWDTTVTWVVRAQEGVKELNPLISNLQGIEPSFYIAFRAGAFLLLQILLWQIYLEGPKNYESAWFRALIGLGVTIYSLPTLMSFLVFL